MGDTDTITRWGIWVTFAMGHAWFMTHACVNCDMFINYNERLRSEFVNAVTRNMHAHIRKTPAFVCFENHYNYIIDMLHNTIIYPFKYNTRAGRIHCWLVIAFVLSVHSRFELVPRLQSIWPDEEGSGVGGRHPPTSRHWLVPRREARPINTRHSSVAKVLFAIIIVCIVRENIGDRRCRW